MIRSVVFKIYLFSVVALVLVFVGNVFAARLFTERARQDTLRQIGQQHGTFIALELDRTLRRSGLGWKPDPAEVASLESGLMVAIRYAPWSAPGGHPARLASERVVFARSGHLLRHYWVRIDRLGHPVGVADVRSRFPHPPPLHHPFDFPFLIAAITGLTMVPPLFVWVVRPLNKMVAVAQRLGEGDLDSPVPLTRSDEFGDLERAFERMRQRILQMLQARDRLLIDISHELRGPLSRVAIALPLLRSRMPEAAVAQSESEAAANAERLRSEAAAQSEATMKTLHVDPGPGAPTSALRYVGQIEDELGRMEALIEELLTLARGRSQAGMEQVPVDLADVARQVWAERAIVARDRGLSVEADLVQAPVTGDPGLLARAMGNFLDNALKYTPRGGRIRLVTRIEGPLAVFRVVDDGPGIPAEALPHLFEPFFRPDVARSRTTGGVGMGLAIARAIAEQHGGHAQIDSVEGQGTSAELVLPLGG